MAPTCAWWMNVDSCGSGPWYGSHGWPGPLGAIHGMGSSLPPKPSSATNVHSPASNAKVSVSPATCVRPNRYVSYLPAS